MRPSEILQIPKWEREQFGTDGWWTAYQVDNAVSYFGLHIEAKLAEQDKDGRHTHTLKQLLAVKPGEKIVNFRPKKQKP